MEKTPVNLGKPQNANVRRLFTKCSIQVCYWKIKQKEKVCWRKMYIQV